MCVSHTSLSRSSSSCARVRCYRRRASATRVPRSTKVKQEISFEPKSRDGQRAARAIEFSSVCNGCSFTAREHLAPSGRFFAEAGACVLIVAEGSSLRQLQWSCNRARAATCHQPQQILRHTPHATRHTPHAMYHSVLHGTGVESPPWPRPNSTPKYLLSSILPEKSGCYSGAGFAAATRKLSNSLTFKVPPAHLIEHFRSQQGI